MVPGVEKQLQPGAMHEAPLTRHPASSTPARANQPDVPRAENLKNSSSHLLRGKGRQRGGKSNRSPSLSAPGGTSQIFVFFYEQPLFFHKLRARDLALFNHGSFLRTHQRCPPHRQLPPVRVLRKSQSFPHQVLHRAPVLPGFLQTRGPARAAGLNPTGPKAPLHFQPPAGSG